MDSVFQITSFLFLPLLSFLILIFFGKNKFKDKSHLVSLPLIGLMLLNAFYYFICSLRSDDFNIMNSFSWLDSGNFNINLGYHIDNISAIMLLVVALISFLVHLYSTEYMKDDPRYSRYYAFLGIFTFSMNGIVLADTLVMMYIFWELVGLSSFLLIGFWFEKNSAANASKKAFLTNRVGDIGMFIGIMILFFEVDSFNIIEITNRVSHMDHNLLTLAGILVFMGAIGKSAQFPLHIWLPDAMEGPTPVSALIHAATMVAAGVYMTFRIFPFLTSHALMFIAIIGAITALMAAIIAITQTDIKRVLAYSTVSQLGYMVMALGVGVPQAAFFHLTTHAMFKACLFLASGSVIHAMHHSLHHLHDHDTDPQDMRNMGGLRKKMPITFLAMLITTLAISGVPFFSGFLSKDMVLAGSLTYYFEHGGWTVFLPIAGFGAAIITAFYMFRLIFMTFYGKPANNKIYEHIHESPKPMTIPLILLSVLSFAFIFSLNPFDGSHGWFAHQVPFGSNPNHITYNVTFDSEHEHEEHLDKGSHEHVPNNIEIPNAIQDIYSPNNKPSADTEHGEHHAHHSLGESHEHYYQEHFEHEVHHNHNLTMALSLLVAFLGILCSAVFYYFKKVNVSTISSVLNKFKLYNLSLNKFYIDELYNTFMYKPFFKLTKISSFIDWNIYDQKIVDAWGWITLKISKYSGKGDYSILDQKIIDGTAHLTNFASKKLRKTQSGVIQNYLMGILVFVVLIIIIFNQIL